MSTALSGSHLWWCSEAGSPSPLRAGLSEQRGSIPHSSSFSPGRDPRQDPADTTFVFSVENKQTFYTRLQIVGLTAILRSLCVFKLQTVNLFFLNTCMKSLVSTTILQLLRIYKEQFLSSLQLFKKYVRQTFYYL